MSDIDWDKVLEEQAKDTGFGAVPAQKYPVRIVKTEAVTAGSGNPMIKLQLEIMGGPYDTRKVFDQLVFSPNPTAMRFTLRDMKAFGITKDFLRENNPSVAQIAVALMGREAEANVEVDTEYNPDEPSNKVKGYRSISGGAPAPAPKAPKPAGVPNVPAPKADAEAPLPKPTIPADTPSGDEEPF